MIVFPGIKQLLLISLIVLILLVEPFRKQLFSLMTSFLNALNSVFNKTIATGKKASSAAVNAFKSLGAIAPAAAKIALIGLGIYFVLLLTLYGVGLMVRVVAALVAVIVGIQKFGEGIAEFPDRLWKSIAGAAGDVGKSISDPVKDVVSDPSKPLDLPGKDNSIPQKSIDGLWRKVRFWDR